MNQPEKQADDATRFRSPELISRTDSGLLVIDVQEKVLAHIDARKQIVWNVDRLIQAAQVLDVSVSMSEQYPARLGATVEPLRERTGDRVSKRMFSCRECGEFQRRWNEQSIRQIVVAGIETHVCILQTVLDLLSEGFSAYVVVDAVGSRGTVDHEVALRRMETAGASMTTTESVLFEWCETSLAPEFKQISQLVKQQAPTR